jgi:acyl carrier protein
VTDIDERGRDLIEEVVRRYVCEELRVSPEAIGVDEDLREVRGAESVKLLRIVARLERHYDVELDEEDVFRVSSIEQMAELLTRLLDSKEATE